MGLFSFLNKTPVKPHHTLHNPYDESATNFVYNLLFCDDLELYRERTQTPYTYPFNVLFAKESSSDDLQKVIDDENVDARIKLLAYRQQVSRGSEPSKKELLAVIVEVGLENGLDVLASFKDGTARYINQSGKILIWETSDDLAANAIKDKLFASSEYIVSQIGIWDKPRLPRPVQGNVRITFLVSDGLYFGEGPMSVLFNDPMAGPALANATALMQYLTAKSLNSNR